MDYSEATQLLKKLDISFKEKLNHKGWIPVKCPSPMHNDNRFGNAGFNVESSTFHCFSCWYSKHIIGTTMEIFEITFEEAKKFLGFKDRDSIDNANQKLVKNRQEKQEESNKSVSFLTPDDYFFDTNEFEPHLYRYTHQRRWRAGWIASSKVLLSFEGYYKDYAIIPIHDNALNIHSFEARKVKEYEYLIDFFNIDENLFEEDKKDKLFSNLKKEFKIYCKKHDIHVKDFKVHVDGHVKADDRIYYLLKPKTLYPKNSNVYETLFNVDNLDFTKPLYVCEGLASIPFLSLIFDNCTCLFGANVSNQQIEYLQKFPEIILIPDNDEAGILLVKNLRPYIKDLKVIFSEYEDTDGVYFEHDLRNFQPIEASRFLIRKFNLIS